MIQLSKKLSYSYHSFSYYEGIIKHPSQEKKICLNKQWYYQEWLPIHSIESTLLTEPVAFNFSTYLTLSHSKQHECNYFAPFLINTPSYQSKWITFRKFYLHMDPMDIVVHYSKKEWVHVSVYLGNKLFLSKLGNMGIYFQPLTEIMEFYQCDPNQIQVLKPDLNNLKKNHETSFKENIIAFQSLL